jgi:hypothetical protein
MPRSDGTGYCVPAGGGDGPGLAVLDAALLEALNQREQVVRGPVPLQLGAGVERGNTGERSLLRAGSVSAAPFRDQGQEYALVPVMPRRLAAKRPLSSPSLPSGGITGTSALSELLTVADQVVPA